MELTPALAAHLEALKEAEAYPKVQREEALQRPWGSVLIAFGFRSGFLQMLILDALRRALYTFG